MSSSKQTPVWPYLIVLAVLFVLSVTAPRAWRSATQKTAPPPVVEQPAEPRVRETAESMPQPEVQIPPPTFALELDPPTVVAAEPSASTVVAPEIDMAAAQVPQPAAREVMELAPPFANQVVEKQVEEPQNEPALELPPTVRVAHLPENKSERPQMTLPESAPTDPADDLQWQAPAALLTQLDRLSQSPDCAAWATHVRSLLLALAEDVDANRGKAQRILPELRQAAQSGAKLASGIAEPPIATLLMRTQYALVRRLDLWDQTPGVGLPGNLPQTTAVAATPAGSQTEMSVCLASIESLTKSHEHGASWREYLLLQDLKAATNANADVAERKKLARTVLARLHHARRTISDRRLLQRGPLASLDAELNRWAAEQVDSRRLLVHVERYEQQLDAGSAQLLADDWRALHWSSNEADQKLATQLDTHYRNANIRLAISGSLVNRFVPQPEAISSPVRDYILGASVRGRSTTFTTLTLKLLPDPRQLRIGFEATGLVDSDTAATSGPATLYSVGQSSFWVRKLAVINANGLRSKPAEAFADNYYSNLVDVESDYDGWPIVGPFVREKAREQHEELRSEARSEVSHRLAHRAREQFDSEMEPRLTKARGEFDRRVLKPLDKLALDLTPVDMATTNDRLVMRLRVAGSDQLAAHTPRPRALSDSVVSLQLHESALNNVLERLDLPGREFTIAELAAHVTERLSMQPAKLPDDLPENVAITFADEGAVRLHCVDGRMQVTLNVKELTQGRHRWHDFSVIAYYQPQIIGQSASLVRDGGIQLGGESIRGKPELLLRSIFSKALSKNRPWNLVDPKLAADPRLSDLEVTQFTVEDGWIGLSYSPRRVPSSVAGKKATTKQR